MPETQPVREPIRVWFMRTSLDKIGGAERVISQVMLGLPRPEFEPIGVWLYGSGGYGEILQKRGIRTYQGLGRARWDVRIGIRLMRLARELRPDVLLTTENALACFWAGMLKRLRLTKALVIAFHITRMERRSYRASVRFSAPVADRLVALTPAHRDYWQQFTGAPQERFVIIPNGVDTDHFKPAEDKCALRADLGLPINACIVGLVAYFKPVKNLPLFVEVAGRLVQSQNDFHFVLVGDGPERERVLQAIAARRLEARFTLPGACDDPRVWHQAFDILLLTSHSEALPVTILEANSCGVPAVATRVGGVPDVIRHGETGFIAPPEDADELTQFVAALAHDAAKRHTMGVAARLWVEQNFSQHAMVARYAQLFRTLAGKDAKPLV
jgi:glycosyltransferase involved in cell wall biosynthesis